MGEWTQKGNTLTRTIVAKSFSDIIEKLAAVAKEANTMNHHPDFSVFGYKNIRFELSTHSEGKVTDKDHELARKIDAIFD